MNRAGNFRMVDIETNVFKLNIRIQQSGFLVSHSKVPSSVYITLTIKSVLKRLSIIKTMNNKHLNS